MPLFKEIVSVFEYKTEWLPSVPVAYFRNTAADLRAIAENTLLAQQDRLNALGRLGWELTALVPVGIDGSLAYFKRKIY
jgi:hypothetical protein